jgi:cyanophycinase
VPIGADYQRATLALFAQQALAHDRDGVVTIRVLLPPFAFDSQVATPEERAQNLADAEVRAADLRAACAAVIAPPVTCEVTVPDVQIRADAEDGAKVAAFAPGVDGVYALGGDQVIAMEIIAGTPLEDALEVLHDDGVPLGGNSAGCAIQGRYMIAGLTGDNFAWNGLERGAVDLAYEGTASVRRGLRFGIDRAIIEQHALQRGRLARSLQAVFESPRRKLGLGPDWRTGVVVDGRDRVVETAGLASAFVIDQETYGAAARGAYRGERQSLSLRNVALHLLPAGGYGYDLRAQRPLLGGALQPAVPSLRGRRFEHLEGQPGGPLYLGGDLLDDDAAAIAPVGLGSVFAEFAGAAAAAGGRVALVGVGGDAGTAAELATIAAALTARGLTVLPLVIAAGTDLAAAAAVLDGADAIYVTAEDQPAVASLLPALDALDLGKRGGAGAPLLLDNAAAAAAGAWMLAVPTAADRLSAKEDAATPPYLASYAAPVPGLGLVPGAAFEARAFYDYRFGRLVQHGYRHPDVVAFGIERETAIRIDARGARVVGPAAVLSIDPRFATRLEAGPQGAIAALWLVVDTFTTGERVRPARP